MAWFTKHKQYSNYKATIYEVMVRSGTIDLSASVIGDFDLSMNFLYGVQSA